MHTIEHVHILLSYSNLFLSWSEICCCLVHQFLPSLFSTDPSLSTENVFSVLETVRDWETVSVVLNVPGSRQGISRKEFSDESLRRQAAVDWWLRYSPTASWTRLAGRLYYREERTALEAVSQYIHKETTGTDNFLTSYSCSPIHSPQCHSAKLLYGFSHSTIKKHFLNSS